ncbi:MAG: RNA polymerase sigma factor [Porphyromonadaceae bacterium]|nr:RNA polymerase sigma factor [Porphyromonadaceae bacterium]MDD6313867.1 RNA polymerase sigma factor [Porphyromonadaceae bacterium]
MSDKSSFKSMVFAMQSNLMAFAMKLTLNKEEAQDLVQDTNLKALKNEAKFVDASNPRGWMLTIMRNIFINNYRRSTRENIVLDTSDDGYLLNLPQESGMSNPEGAFALGEITSIIEKFPEDYRQPFNLHVAGYKYEEIADKLRMPLGTVKSRIFTIRKQLREILKDYR